MHLKIALCHPRPKYRLSVKTTICITYKYVTQLNLHSLTIAQIIQIEKRTTEQQVTNLQVHTKNNKDRSTREM